MVIGDADCHVDQLADRVTHDGLWVGRPSGDQTPADPAGVGSDDHGVAAWAVAVTAQPGVATNRSRVPGRDLDDLDRLDGVVEKGHRRLFLGVISCEVGLTGASI